MVGSGVSIFANLETQDLDFYGNAKFYYKYISCVIVSLITAGAIWVSDMATSGGYLNMTPGQREQYEAVQCTPESLEREKLLSLECTSDLSADSLIQPQSDIRIRNRYLSRIGAMVSRFS